MNNIIITPAVGMPANDVVLFLASLRKFNNKEVLFFVGKKDFELKKIYIDETYPDYIRKNKTFLNEWII